MVQLINSGGLDTKKVTMKQSRAFPEPESTKRSVVKLEIADADADADAEEERWPPSKRCKHLAPFQQLCMETGMVPPQPVLYNPLDEPSPLGLRLRKSPSLLDLIQMRLSQGDPAALGVDTSGGLDSATGDQKGAVASGTTDKLKASNFPASLLRIGSWECVSRHEGDLVAKCYFAKHKLVWEVLDGGLKSKIEIQWSDITALKATLPDNGPGTLDIVLARQPLFFRETNPQPRKHTLWQATSDFTGGQAAINRRHFLKVLPGLLNKHFEKLIQCDPRLNLLSQRGDITLDSPYFDSRGPAFEDQSDSKFHGLDHLKNDRVSMFSGFPDSGSTCTAQSLGLKTDPVDPVGRVHESVSHETPSPSSVMDSGAIEERTCNEIEKSKGSNFWEQLKVPALRGSMSVSDLVNHLEHCITEQRTSGNPATSGEGQWNKDILDEITQHLLGDSQNPLASDEQCLMSRVNSLYCLLQKDANTDQALQMNYQKKVDAEASTDEQSDDDDDDDDHRDTVSPLGGNRKMYEHATSSKFQGDNVNSKLNSAMSRRDSLSDLLLGLPRIASLPKFLVSPSDDGGHAR